MFESLTVPSIAPCSLATFLDNIDEKSRANLEDALNSAISNRSIWRAIRSESATEIPVGVETITAHRAGKCRCSRVR